MPSSNNLPRICPVETDETAEAYAMGRLSIADALQFAIHCLTCRQCAAVAEEAKGFVRAMKAATRRLDEGPEDPPRLRSRASLTSVTTTPMGNANVRMRFEVTVCEATRTPQCRTAFRMP
jgi:hypothetical protein